MGTQSFIVAALAMCNIASGALRVEQILQVPSDRAQTVTSFAVDRQGNPIVTGSNVQGGFVSKLDPRGNLVFTFANFGSFPTAAAADAKGDIYWVGSAGFSFPFTKKILPVPDRGSHSPGFVVKFRGTDGAIIWAAELDGLQPQAIVLDAAGQITLAGGATAAHGVGTAGAYQSPALRDIPPLGIVRLTGDGDVIFAATYGGHSFKDPEPCVNNAWLVCLYDPGISAASILLDTQGNIWVAGATYQTDVPVTANALKKECGCGTYLGDGFLAEFSADGASLLYATYVGTSGDDAIRAASVDGSGRVWLGGITNGAGLPVTSDAAQSSLMGDQDGFLLEYDPAANRIVYASYYGTQGTNSITRVAIGTDGRPVFTGHLNSNRFNPYSFGTDFVAVLQPSGIDTTPFLRNGAGAGLAFSPSGALVVLGSGSVISMLRDSTATSPAIFAITNAASLQATGQVSAGEIISVFGTNFGRRGEVLFDGLAAPLLYTSETQLNAVVPFGVAGRQETRMTVRAAGVISNEARLGVIPATPALFVTNDVLQNLPVAAAINEDGTVNSATHPAAPGSIVSIYGTGFGALTPAPVDGSTVIAPLPELQERVGVFVPDFADVQYAGPAPGQVAGVTQINFRISANPTILVFSGGWSANFFTVWIKGS
jgi:uncharacterized protein (TIGR03437 family)